MTQDQIDQLTEQYMFLHLDYERTQNSIQDPTLLDYNQLEDSSPSPLSSPSASPQPLPVPEQSSPPQIELSPTSVSLIKETMRNLNLTPPEWAKDVSNESLHKAIESIKRIQ